MGWFFKCLEGSGLWQASEGWEKWLSRASCKNTLCPSTLTLLLRGRLLSACECMTTALPITVTCLLGLLNPGDSSDPETKGTLFAASVGSRVWIQDLSWACLAFCPGIPDSYCPWYGKTINQVAEAVTSPLA